MVAERQETECGESGENEVTREKTQASRAREGVRKENHSRNRDYSCKYWACNSLLKGLWGYDLVTCSKGALGVHKHPTGLGAADKCSLLLAAF